MRNFDSKGRFEMKRIVLLTLAAVLLLSGALVFAGGGKEAPSAGPKKFRVAVSLPPANNSRPWLARAEAAKPSSSVPMTLANSSPV